MADEPSVVVRPAVADDADLLLELTVVAGDWSGAMGLTVDAVLADPSFAHYAVGWPRAGDVGVVAMIDGAEAGAAWARPLAEHEAGYGYVADDVPEIVIGVRAAHRGRGIGEALLSALIEALRSAGYRAVSLSVDDGNPARRLYLRHGFAVVGRNGDSDTMLLNLQ